MVDFGEKYSGKMQRAAPMEGGPLLLSIQSDAKINNPDSV